MRKIVLRPWMRIVLLLIAIAGLLVLWFVGPSTWRIARAWLNDNPATHNLAKSHVDDASRLNATRVAQVIPLPADPIAAEQQLRDLLQRARQDHLRISIAGARHSMGGHTIYPDGIMLDMLSFNRMELSPDKKILHVGAGARWSKVIPYLDSKGASVWVMQSFNDFTVGGSLSVNCHGWEPDIPIAATVESFRLMKADGQIVLCSRVENTELFSLVLGGYGLFGVILDVDLRVVPNQRYQPDIRIIDTRQYVTHYHHAMDPNLPINKTNPVGMVFGRMCVVPGDKTFLQKSIFTIFRSSPCKPEEIPKLQILPMPTFRREVYRAQIGSDEGKALRWRAETLLGEQMASPLVSRNLLINESVDSYAEHNNDRTDILQEYFIPEASVNQFVECMRTLIPNRGPDLLNVTIRNLHADSDSFLRYADQDMFAFVLLFNQERTPEADARTATVTRDLIDAALACGGRYYLPYRAHATAEQFHRAYPQAQRFFELKRKYDPDEIFQNQWYLDYGKAK